MSSHRSCFALLGLVTPAALAMGQSFTILSPPSTSFQSQALGVSRNGRFTCGSTSDPATQTQTACTWTAAGHVAFLPIQSEEIPVNDAWAVSNDGTVVAGDSAFTAVVWGPGGHALPGQGVAYGLTPDGSISVGYIYTSGSPVEDQRARGFRRTASGQMTLLDPLPGDESVARAITPDGHFIAGQSFVGGIPPRATAVVWHDGVATPFADHILQELYYLDEPLAISDDGSVVVGSVGSLDGVALPARWVNGVADPEFFTWGFGSANACSADGSVVVGGTGDDDAFIWDAVHHRRGIRSLLTGAGIDLTGVRLVSATGISADGNVVVGLGLDEASGSSFAWRAALGPEAPACPADFNHDNDLNPDDLSDYITCYFSTPACSEADFNHDTDVNPDDLGDYITAYFQGCP